MQEIRVLLESLKEQQKQTTEALLMQLEASVKATALIQDQIDKLKLKDIEPFTVTITNLETGQIVTAAAAEKDTRDFGLLDAPRDEEITDPVADTQENDMNAAADAPVGVNQEDQAMNVEVRDADTAQEAINEVSEEFPTVASDTAAGVNQEDQTMNVEVRDADTTQDAPNEVSEELPTVPSDTAVGVNQEDQIMNDEVRDADTTQDAINEVSEQLPTTEEETANDVDADPVTDTANNDIAPVVEAPVQESPESEMQIDEPTPTEPEPVPVAVPAPVSDQYAGIPSFAEKRKKFNLLNIIIQSNFNSGVVIQARGLKTKTTTGLKNLATSVAEQKKLDIEAGIARVRAFLAGNNSPVILNRSNAAETEKGSVQNTPSRIERDESTRTSSPSVEKETASSDAPMEVENESPVVDTSATLAANRTGPKSVNSTTANTNENQPTPNVTTVRKGLFPRTGENGKDSHTSGRIKFTNGNTNVPPTPDVEKSVKSPKGISSVGFFSLSAKSTPASTGPRNTPNQTPTPTATRNTPNQTPTANSMRNTPNQTPAAEIAKETATPASENPFNDTIFSQQSASTRISGSKNSNAGTPLAGKSQGKINTGRTPKSVANNSVTVNVINNNSNSLSANTANESDEFSPQASNGSLTTPNSTPKTVNVVKNVASTTNAQATPKSVNPEPPARNARSVSNAGKSNSALTLKLTKPSPLSRNSRRGSMPELTAPKATKDRNQPKEVDVNKAPAVTKPSKPIGPQKPTPEGVVTPAPKEPKSVEAPKTNSSTKVPLINKYIESSEPSPPVEKKTASQQQPAEKSKDKDRQSPLGDADFVLGSELTPEDFNLSISPPLVGRVRISSDESLDENTVEMLMDTFTTEKNPRKSLGKDSGFKLVRYSQSPPPSKGKTGDQPKGSSFTRVIGSTSDNKQSLASEIAQKRKAEYAESALNKVPRTRADDQPRHSLKSLEPSPQALSLFKQYTFQKPTVSFQKTISKQPTTQINEALKPKPPPTPDQSTEIPKKLVSGTPASLTSATLFSSPARSQSQSTQNTPNNSQSQMLSDIRPTPPKPESSPDQKKRRKITSDTICFTFNTDAGCHESPCMLSHLCAFCSEPHSIQECEFALRDWRVCIKFNRSTCRTTNCWREHRCLRCGSQSHKIGACNADPVNNFDYKKARNVCDIWNNEPVARHTPESCQKSDVCLRCGEKTHSAMLCEHNADNYRLKTGLD